MRKLSEPMLRLLKLLAEGGVGRSISSSSSSGGNLPFYVRRDSLSFSFSINTALALVSRGLVSRGLVSRRYGFPTSYYEINSDGLDYLTKLTRLQLKEERGKMTDREDPHCGSCGIFADATGVRCLCLCHQWKDRTCPCGGVRVPQIYSVGSNNAFDVSSAKCNRCYTVWGDPIA